MPSTDVSATTVSLLMVDANGNKNEIIVSAADYYNNRYNKAGSEDNLYDNTYIKLRELKLSYRVPKTSFPESVYRI